ncbi:MAG: DNA repair protein RecN [Elusimicrobium sp.]|nr:DNA repair protein RecN [Elusimicrobium sp.]
MLKNLQIKNFAILDDINLDLSAGLNVFSGETGAGKSIIIEALGFALGARAGLSMLKEGAQNMSVAAVFETEDLPKKFLQEYKISGNAVTLKRELDAKGKTRGFIGNTLVPAGALAALGEFLVDFHGQQDHHTLLKSSEHLAMLDRFAKTQKDVLHVSQLYADMQDILAKINALSLSKAEKERLLDLYNFQYKEITDAALKPGEDIEIDNALPKLKHSGKLKELAENAYQFLYEGEAAGIDTLSKALKNLRDMCELDETLRPMLSELESALRSIEDGAAAVYDYKEHISVDPQTLDDMLSRQQKTAKLKSKYGPEISDVLAKAEELKKQIDSLSFSEEKEAELRAQLSAVKEELLTGAMVLHEKRVNAAQKLDARVIAEIKPLGFSEVKFKTDIIFEEESVGATGADSVEFLFSPNPGQSLKPLKNIASGGEMSRVMLGLKTVLAGTVPVMVFDEIDAGIGGATGLKVGEKLRAVSAGRQTLCVTHLPQVAAFGAAHFNVNKISSKNTTRVILTRLEGESRTSEIARMLGSISGKMTAGFKHAQELIDYCRNS